MKIRTVIKWVLTASLIASFGIVYFEYKQVTELTRFRRSDDSFLKEASIDLRKGLDDLHISGSCRPSAIALKKALSNINMPIYIFDLLGEDHYYIQGMPERWYGYKYSPIIGESKDKRSLRTILHSLIYTGTLHHTEEDAQTERELIEEIGFHYIGTNQERRTAPTPEQVDDFIQTVVSLPNPCWIHFHCSAGRGRTTVAMVMYDILKNGKTVFLEDIIRRHQLLGSENLFDITVWSNGRYTKEMLKGRKDFVISFYKYVNDPQGLGVTSWKEWIVKKAQA